MSRWFCGIALVFVILSLGPAVDVGGQRLSNPLYFVVSWVLPTYGSAPVPFQQVGVFAALAGLGLLAFPVFGAYDWYLGHQRLRAYRTKRRSRISLGSSLPMTCKVPDIFLIFTT